MPTKAQSHRTHIGLGISLFCLYSPLWLWIVIFNPSCIFVSIPGNNVVTSESGQDNYSSFLPTMRQVFLASIFSYFLLWSPPHKKNIWLLGSQTSKCPLQAWNKYSKHYWALPMWKHYLFWIDDLTKPFNNTMR